MQKNSNLNYVTDLLIAFLFFRPILVIGVMFLSIYGTHWALMWLFGFQN